MHPALRPAVDYTLQIAEAYGVPVTLTSLRRTCEQQAELRNNYLAGLSPYPANRPGDSGHQYGVAWDSVVPAEYWPAWDFIRRAVGWKVHDHDRPHAELPEWRQYTGTGGCG